MQNGKLPPETTAYANDDVPSDDAFQFHERLRQVEKTQALVVSELGRVSRDLRRLTNLLSDGPAMRRTPSRAIRAISGLKDRDIRPGQCYLTWIANPRKPYQKRVMVLGGGHVTDPATGVTAWNCVGAADGRTVNKPRLAAELFPVPDNWVDPIEDEEEPTRSTNRPRA